jgi:Rha family phage regulatory protein
MELVELKQNEIYCDSVVIARKFGMQHAKVVQTMEILIPKLDDFRVKELHPKIKGLDPKYLIEQRNYRGNLFQAYLINKDCFIILAMRFNTIQAREWQGKFIAAFNTMEQHISQSLGNKKDPAWLKTRTFYKIARNLNNYPILNIPGGPNQIKHALYETPKQHCSPASSTRQPHFSVTGGSIIGRR